MKKSGFAKAERIKRFAEIQKIFRKGKKISCDGVKLFVLSNGMERNRIVFTFPRGYGSAVERNFSRRLSREAYRLNKQNIRIGFDLIVLVFPGKDSFTVREGQFRILFSKAGLWLKDT